ncbi:hypothetical protein RRV45_10775 [Bacillus sp. DTU_2020_1000418_1_SI_GHA_SEK_038]|uniref:hypothetical protein n=1 Tax=Bacillus sp. DTU_2020_1000418_1_SI_GHA_SEK_038 TaxID=3077585 RepID=UPI0028E6E794|nr:hypothetical protein [Bacillus sp. DTU_2020_1000418_1_SI_GHA_SEK_038]WNS77438.1 hypothetical protein RRV45_10775 [Bacillus sp. DTU_2020_1000418_1_SI_GHA_SEK_038]
MAKRCAICDQTWDDSNLNCPIDGAALTPVRKVISTPPQQTHDASETQANAQAPYQASQFAATAPQTSSAQASIQVKPGNAYVEGTVRNFHEDIIKTNPVKQWFLSLRKGCHFVRDGNICTFDVDDPKGDIHSVILYGKVIRGRFQDHSYIRVYGTQDRHNTIVAKQIENLGSNSSVAVNKTLSSLAVRVITGLIAIFLLYFILFVDLSTLLQSLSAGITNFVVSVLSAIFPLIIIGFVFWMLIRKFFK